MRQLHSCLRVQQSRQGDATTHAGGVVEWPEATQKALFQQLPDQRNQLFIGDAEFGRDGRKRLLGEWEITLPLIDELALRFIHLRFARVAMKVAYSGSLHHVV